MNTTLQKIYLFCLALYGIFFNIPLSFAETSPEITSRFLANSLSLYYVQTPASTAKEPEKTLPLPSQYIKHRQRSLPIRCKQQCIQKWGGLRCVKHCI